MNIQSINTDTRQPNFQRLIIQKGSFKALKQSKYFPQNKNYPLYNNNMQNFYKQLIQLKQRAQKNDLYNVILKPDRDIDGKHGFVVIENNEGREQDGFKQSFNELLRIQEYEPKRYYTEEDLPNPILRWYKNKQISWNNKKIINHKMDFNDFLNIVYKRIESIVNNAEYLTDLRKLKEGS